jgi:hypothetical protein
LKLLSLVNSQAVRLPDHPELLRQLRGLERRRGWGGKDRVDHPRNQHDDLSNVAAGALVLCQEAAGHQPARLWMAGDARSDDALTADARDLAERIRENGNAYFPGADP